MMFFKLNIYSKFGMFNIYVELDWIGFLIDIPAKGFSMAIHQNF